MAVQRNNKTNTGYQATLGNVAANDGTLGILSPEADLSFTVAEGYLSTSDRHSLGHPDTFDYSKSGSGGPGNSVPSGSELPAVTHLGRAGGGHDDPSSQVPVDPGFVIGQDVAPPPVKGGDLKVGGSTGHDDPSSRSSKASGYGKYD